MRIVKLSKRASVKLDLLLEYLESEWSVKVKHNFIKKLDKALKQIQKYPESGKKTHAIKGLRKLVLTKQTSLYYRFNSKEISIITLFDNRMEPGKLKKEIK